MRTGVEPGGQQGSDRRPRFPFGSLRPLFRFGALDHRILALALPALGALLVEPLYNLTDSAIVGHLGRAPLAALAIAVGVLNIVSWVSGFLDMATVSVVAFHRGAGEADRVGRYVGAAYVLSVLLGAAAALGVGLLAPEATRLLGGHGRVAHDSVIYLRISAGGMVPLLVSLAGYGHLVGLGNTRRPFRIALIANAVNVAVEVAFVYGAHMGIAGSAWGTLVAQCVSAILFVRASLRADPPPGRPRRPELAGLARDGVPLSVRSVALGVALLATTAIAARLGTARLAGHQIAMEVWLTLALVLDSLAVPAQVFVSEALGRSDREAARLVGSRTLVIGLMAGVVAGTAIAATAPVLPYVFSSNADVRHQATIALYVCGICQPVAALAFVLDGLLLGASGYRILQYTMVAALAAFAPLAALTAADHSLGLVGLWAAITCWLGARAGILGWRWAKGAWGRGRGA